MGESDEGFRVSVGAPLTTDEGLESSKPVERSGFIYTQVRVSQKQLTGKLRVIEPAPTENEAVKEVDCHQLNSISAYICPSLLKGSWLAV